MIVFVIYFLFTLIIVFSSLATINNFKQIPGPPGFKGIKGEVGEQGPKGDKGLKGNIGIKGSKGPPGKPGGSRGLPGEQGSMGPQGPKGLTGFRGFRGDNGDDGERGDRGFQGREGLPGPKGLTGIAGEYVFNEIDYETCNTYDFDKNREMKCGSGQVLIEINNNSNNYYGKCCNIKMTTKCVNKKAGKDWTLPTDEEVTEIEKKYIARYPGTQQLYYNYSCEPGFKGVPQGKEFRCCLDDVENLDYNKNY